MLTTVSMPEICFPVIMVTVFFMFIQQIYSFKANKWRYDSKTSL